MSNSNGSNQVAQDNTKSVHLKALILDFGGVISRTLFETHELSEQALGLPRGALTWQGPFHPESDCLWQKMQSGEISERDYWLQRTKEVGLLVGQNWTEMQTLVQKARGNDVEAIIRPEAIKAIQMVKAAGLKLAIVSNELDLFYGFGFSQKLALLKNFDVIEDATYTEVLKPDPKAYLSCLTSLQLLANECVFVDDQIKNIKGAQQVGLHTVHFDVKNPAFSYEQALNFLGLSFLK